MTTLPRCGTVHTAHGTAVCYRLLEILGQNGILRVGAGDAVVAD
jgi:hypothetical protein